MRNILLPIAAIACVGAFCAVIAMPGEAKLSEFATGLNGRTRSQRHNAILSLEALDGAVIEPGAVFSFNARVGSFSRDRGYRKAPVSYNGQLIDSWGGGVCQTSTTLYNAALYARMEIVERNRHRFAPSYVPPGRDAAVAFNTIDLRFRNPHTGPVRIRGRVVDDRLVIEMLGAASPSSTQIVSDVRSITEPSTFEMGRGRASRRLRNSGKPGFEVAVYRITGPHKELVSVDSYPAMHRIVEGF